MGQVCKAVGGPQALHCNAVVLLHLPALDVQHTRHLHAVQCPVIDGNTMESSQDFASEHVQRA